MRDDKIASSTNYRQPSECAGPLTQWDAYTYALCEHHFRREQDLTEQTISRIQSGITNSQAASKSKYVQVATTAILPTYAGRDLNDYLRAVSHNIDV